MRHFSDAYAALRRKNRGQYALLAGCSFFSVLLITAYVCMMRSPTILSVLPEGGDSRKQVMMVFVLAVIGCAVFTAYAAGLFFRQKSRETGVFLALGATHIETVFRVSVPAARSGIATAIVLGIGRAIGEAMAIIMVAGNVANMPGLLTPVRFLTTAIASEMSYASVGSLHRNALFSIGLVLFLFIMLINVFLNVFIKRKKED